LVEGTKKTDAPAARRVCAQPLHSALHCTALHIRSIRSINPRFAIAGPGSSNHTRIWREAKFSQQLLHSREVATKQKQASANEGENAALPSSSEASKSPTPRNARTSIGECNRLGPIRDEQQCHKEPKRGTLGGQAKNCATRWSRMLAMQSIDPHFRSPLPMTYGKPEDVALQLSFFSLGPPSIFHFVYPLLYVTVVFPSTFARRRHLLCSPVYLFLTHIPSWLSEKEPERYARSSAEALRARLGRLGHLPKSQAQWETIIHL
jgi:hypothetical protein